MVAGSVLGFGLVVNTYASWLSWQGYLLGPFGLGGKTGTWEFANLGVIVALVVAFVGWLVCGRAAVRRQEAAPVSAGRRLGCQLAASRGGRLSWRCGGSGRPPR